MLKLTEIFDLKSIFKTFISQERNMKKFRNDNDEDDFENSFLKNLVK